MDLTPGPAGGEADETDPESPIVTAAMAGDREAFAVLVERHQHRVFGLVVRVLRCDRETAADLSQEVFLNVFRGLHGFDGSDRFVQWLNRITVNVCIGEYRRRKTLKRGRWTHSLDAPLAGTDDRYLEPAAAEREPADKAHHRDIVQAVEAAVADLPDEFRECVLLRDLQNMSYDEIGALLSLPAGTVRSRIHRGRLILQQKLKEYRP